MTFGDILNMVCKDGISSSYRTDAKEWVKTRHEWLWGVEDWTFKVTTASLEFTAGAQVLAAPPSDLHATFAIYDAQGDPLRAIRDVRAFFDLYNTNYVSDNGSPEAYTVVDGQVLVGPKGDGSTGLIVYQKTKPTLSADTDTTGLPDGCDMALVYGAKADGYVATNAGALAPILEERFQAIYEGMMNDWLEAVLETGGQSGAFRPSLQWPAYGR